MEAHLTQKVKHLNLHVTLKRNVMKHLFLLLLSAALLVSCGKDNPKVLLFITDGSRDLELMLTKCLNSNTPGQIDK